MDKYKKKPVIIEAERWFRLGDVPEAPIKSWDNSFDKGRLRCPLCGSFYAEHGLIPTLEGEHIICPGDWVVKGVKGEFYPVKPDIFAETYERC